MNKSATSSSMKIQQGFSLIKEASVIDWGLLVEGHTDALFYEKYENNLTVFYGAPNENESSMISRIVKDKVNKGKNFFGIMDADYEAEKIETKYQSNLTITDAHSLETMLIKHYTPKEFEKKIIKKLNYKFSFRNYEDKEIETVEKSLHWAYKIGVIRELNQQNNENIDFKTVKKNSKNYLIFLTIKQNELEFEFDSYLDKLFTTNAQLKTKYSKEFFTKLVEQKEKSYSSDVWKLCHGHDVMNFIESSKRFYSSIDDHQYDLYGKQEVTRYANMAIEKCNTSFFEGSTLTTWFENINKTYKAKIEKELLSIVVD